MGVFFIFVRALLKIIYQSWGHRMGGFCAWCRWQLEYLAQATQIVL